MSSEHRSLLDIHDIVSPKHKAYTQLSGTFDTLRWELTKAEMVQQAYGSLIAPGSERTTSTKNLVVGKTNPLAVRR